MQEFRVFRAIGLAFKSWFSNFIPFTLLTAVLYAPAIIWLQMHDPREITTPDQLNNYAMIPDLMVEGAALLLSPMLTYRVIQELNGTKASMLTSIKFGLRGVLPALILGVITAVLARIGLIGAIINIVLMCIFFVACSAAVAERLNPFKALSRSAELTSGRRWGIFGLMLLIGLAIAGIIIAIVAPMATKTLDEVIPSIKGIVIAIIVVAGVLKMFMGIVEAVSYALLRSDKDGMSHEALAKVFE